TVRQEPNFVTVRSLKKSAGAFAVSEKLTVMFVVVQFWPFLSHRVTGTTPEAGAVGRVSGTRGLVLSVEPVGGRGGGDVVGSENLTRNLSRPRPPDFEMVPSLFSRFWEA